MNFIDKIIKLTLCKKKFFLPEKKKVLVLDKNFDFLIGRFLKGKPEFIDIRLNEINIPILFKLFFSGKKNIFFNYILEYIKYVDCKYIITFNDNLSWFYKLKENFPEKKFLAFQNGFRAKFFFDSLKKNKQKLSADLICTFNKNFADEYKKKISSKVLVLGSFKNNLNKITKYKKKRSSILLVSSGYPEKKYFSTYNESYKYPSNIFYKNDKILIKSVVSFCRANNIELEITPKNKDDEREFLFFKKIIDNFDFKYHKNNYANMKTYQIADQVNMTVCSHSTFGFENLSRGNKTAIFNNKKKVTKGAWDIFWYLNLKSRGFFWTDSSNEVEIKKLLHTIYFINSYKWKKNTKSISNKMMYYDKDKKKLHKLQKMINA